MSVSTKHDRRVSSLRQLTLETSREEIFAQMAVIGLGALTERTARIAATDGTVLIDGESGTGKSTLAGWIHALSPRSNARLVRRGCGEFEPMTFAATLFGHTRDAFTGAVAEKEGTLDLVDGGTLILDDIDYLNLSAQQSLLRVLDDGLFFRLGDPRGIRRVNLRLVVTTNKSLDTMVEDGQFLPDLYYRLQRWRLSVPRLAERSQAFKQVIATVFEAAGAPPDTTLTPDLEAYLARRQWPGNLRELRDVVENILVFAEPRAGSISLAAAKGVMAQLDYCPTKAPDTDPCDDAAIRACLDSVKWNVSLAARILGISRTTLYARIRAGKWLRPKTG